jgi:hypothetical protein
LHFPIASNRDLLVLVFLRMGGESAPWGIAVGRPGSRPRLLTVPEARNRDLVAGIAAELAPILLEHFRHPEHSNVRDRSDLDDLALRQIWLPNPSHLEMLHHLAYAYTFARWGDEARARSLRQLGRLAGWLFRESQRPGQLTAIVATDALRESFVFPAEDVRQSHLGFLLGWLTTRGSRERRSQAAADAERLTISTTLDPALERDRLEPQVTAYGEASKAGQTRAAAGAADRIRRELEGELVRRFALTEEAIEVLRGDRRRQNAGLASLAKSSKDEFWYRYLRAEVEREDADESAVYTPSPETDRNAAAAADRYYRQSASEEARFAALLQDDPALQDETIAEGDAFRGTITSVRDEGTSRTTRPVWTLSSAIEGTRLRAGNTLCVAGLPSRHVRVRRLDLDSSGAITLEVEVTKLVTRPRAAGRERVLAGADPGNIGRTVTLLPVANEGIAERKARKVWARGTPGSWLTSGVPGGRAAALPAEVADDLRTVGSD